MLPGLGMQGVLGRCLRFAKTEIVPLIETNSRKICRPDEDGQRNPDTTQEEHIVPAPNIKTILYATDLGENTRPVFRLAVSQARRYNARLLMLHVVEPRSAPPARRSSPTIFPARRWIRSIRMVPAISSRS